MKTLKDLNLSKEVLQSLTISVSSFICFLFYCYVVCKKHPLIICIAFVFERHIQRVRVDQRYQSYNVPHNASLTQNHTFELSRFKSNTKVSRYAWISMKRLKSTWLYNREEWFRSLFHRTSSRQFLWSVQTRDAFSGAATSKLCHVHTSLLTIIQIKTFGKYPRLIYWLKKRKPEAHCQLMRLDTNWCRKWSGWQRPWKTLSSKACSLIMPKKSATLLSKR